MRPPPSRTTSCTGPGAPMTPARMGYTSKHRPCLPISQGLASCRAPALLSHQASGCKLASRRAAVCTTTAPVDMKADVQQATALVMRDGGVGIYAAQTSMKLSILAGCESSEPGHTHTCKPQPRCQLSSSCALAMSDTISSRGFGTPSALHLLGSRGSVGGQRQQRYCKASTLE